MKKLTSIQIRILHYLNGKELPAPLASMSSEVFDKTSKDTVFVLALDMEKMGLVLTRNMPLDDGKIIEITDAGREALIKTMTDTGEEL